MAERIRRSLSLTEVQGSIPVDAHLPLHMEWIALLVKFRNVKGCSAYILVWVFSKDTN